MLKLYGVKNNYFRPGHADKMIKAAAESDKNPHRYSKVNLEWLKLFNENNIPTTAEYTIGRKSFDFNITDTNILIEINPTITHNSTKSFLSILGIKENAEPLSNTYHIERLKFTEEHSMILLNVWDWTDKEMFLTLLNSSLKGLDLDPAPYLEKDFIDFNYYQLFGDCIETNVKLVNNCIVDNNKKVFVPSYKILNK